ncbi:sensor histidine kinase [Cohnella zeiphila]|uniref:Sensor histidine kinase n=1 Tax=Cohnella zeiphila TaxID=2761120 RepID=A0A7X0SM63_9BACL|nr:sensor histidine kinase [Cohnella zeiphila]MBB6732439.1 sensor histidine kinase [Cohnella zeiphila]
MISLKRLPLFHSVRSQILVLLLAFIVAPTTVVSVFTIDQSTGIIERNAMAMLETALEHSKENTSNFMGDAADAVLMVMTNDTVTALLRQEEPAGPQQKLAVSNALEKYLFELKVHGTMAKEIAILNANGEKIYAGASAFRPEAVADPNWREEVDRLDGKPYWGSFDNGSAYVFVAREVREYVKSEDRFRPIGMVVISFDERDFSAINDSVHLANRSQILIGDPQGRIVSGSDSSHVGEALSTVAFPLERGTRSLDLSPLFPKDQAGKRLTVYDAIPNSDWSLIVDSPLSDVLQNQRSIKRIILYSTGLCVVGALALAALFAHRMTMPLKKLSKEVKRRIRSGDFAFWPQQPPAFQDEIAELGQGFYRLVADLNETKNRMHRAEIMTKEAEFDAMKSKIKPHFLYNSLESIRMLAVVNKDLVTAEMLKSLGHLFRYLIADRKREITLRDELEYLQSYINLQKIRYEDRLQVEVDIPERWLDAKIEKLVLQPLVENSIEHGIDRKRGAQRVRITAAEIEDKAGSGLVLQVWDDGAGMEPETLADIRARLNDLSEEREHIGLSNVHRRLRLRFGEPCGLTVESEPGEYTSVYVRIPATDGVAEGRGSDV